MIGSIAPEGYDHKATSESFNQGQSVEIYYSRMADEYLVVVIDEDGDEKPYYFNKTQLELLVHAASDVLHDQKV